MNIEKLVDSLNEKELELASKSIIAAMASVVFNKLKTLEQSEKEIELEKQAAEQAAEQAILNQLELKNEIISSLFSALEGISFFYEKWKDSNENLTAEDKQAYEQVMQEVKTLIIANKVKWMIGDSNNLASM